MRFSSYAATFLIALPIINASTTTDRQQPSNEGDCGGNNLAGWLFMPCVGSVDSRAGVLLISGAIKHCIYCIECSGDSQVVKCADHLQNTLCRC